MFVVAIFIAILGLLGSGYLLWRNPVTVAIAAIAWAVLSDLTGIGATGIQAGVTIYPLDMGCAALIACCAVVALQTRSLPADICWPALALLGLALLNFSRGVLAFGIKSAGNDARELIYFILPVVAFSCLASAMRMNTERMVRYVCIASLGLAVIALARWAGVLAMPADDFTDDFREVVRVLPSDYAVFIGQALIGVLGVQLIRGFRTSGLVLAGIFAALVFALQHRSVWLATGAGLLWLAVRSPRLPKRDWLRFVTISLLLAAVAVLAPLAASAFFGKAMKLVNSNVQEINQEDSTWAWRMDGYTEATRRVFSGGVAETLIGPPSGRDLSNIAGFASIHIHNRYVHTLAYYGLAGLSALLVWLFSTGTRIRRLGQLSEHRHAHINKIILESMFVSALAYFIPYSAGQLEGALMGAIWLASTVRVAYTPDKSRRLAAPGTLLKSGSGVYLQVKS